MELYSPMFRSTSYLKALGFCKNCGKLFRVLSRRSISGFITETKTTEIVTPHSKYPMHLSYGKLAKLADGNAIISVGNTAVLVACVSSSRISTGNFMPLVVDYRQKAAAAGRIPTNYLRRELGPSEKEILTGRMIDRSLRPGFSNGYMNEVQIMCNVLSIDGLIDPDVVAINTASASLLLSNIPWNGPVAAVRIGLIDNEPIVNPTRKELQHSEIDLIVTAADRSRVVMLEGSAKSVLQQDLLKAIKLGVKECQVIIQEMKKFQTKFGKSKKDFQVAYSPSEEILDAVESLCQARLKTIFLDSSLDKLSRDEQIFGIRDDVLAKLRESFPDIDSNTFNEGFYRVEKSTYKKLVLENKIRCDGRGLNDIRPISCEIDLYPPLHGSAMFQRGQTQVLCTVAFDSLESSLKSDPVSMMTSGVREKNFMLHYEFPPYATNSTGQLSGSRRRELGHGALAEKSLRCVLPDNFPFTVRLTSEVMESNGSSSMASVCGGSLALMDAGVPISEPVAGVAMGLIGQINEDQELADYAVLTDLLGIEDHLGLMDFKLAGTKKGISGLQLDVKLPGLPLRVIMESIISACVAKGKILDIMNDVISYPRKIKKSNWPVTEKLEVAPSKRSRFVGLGGFNLRKIMSQTGVQLTPEDETHFNIFAPNAAALNEAKEIIEKLLTEENAPELQFGTIYTAKIVELRDSGVMVTLYDSMTPTLLHNSQLDQRKVYHPSALGIEVGQEIQVKYFGRDPVSGSIRLSRKVLQSVPTTIVQNLSSS